MTSSPKVIALFLQGIELFIFSTTITLPVNTLTIVNNFSQSQSLDLTENILLLPLVFHKRSLTYCEESYELQQKIQAGRTKLSKVMFHGLHDLAPGSEKN
jgi:hypothetical protein